MKLRYLILGGLVLVFTLDLLTRSGVAIGVLYALCIMAASVCSKRSSIVWTTVLAILLTGLALLAFPEIALEGYVLANRALTILFLLLSGIVAYFLFRAREKMERANSEIARNERFLGIAGRLVRFGGWGVNLRDNRVALSDEVARIHGVDPGFSPTPEEAIAFYSPEAREPIETAFTRCATLGVPYDLQLRLMPAGGAPIWVRTAGEAVRDESGAIVEVQGAFQDLDDQVRLADRLVRNLESMSDAFFTVDLDWRFTYVNRQAEKMLGKHRDELLGRELWEAFPGAVGTRFESEYRRAVETNQSVTLEEFFEPLQLWVGVNAHPSPGGLSVYFRDVTENRKADERMRQVERLEAVGQLTGGVAHDFNNLLTVIMSGADMLANRVADDAHAKRLADAITVAAERGALLNQRLLAFSGQQSLFPESVDVAEFVQGMLPRIRRAMTENISVQGIAEPRKYPISVDVSQLEIALMALCTNAKHALPMGGRITIDVQEASVAPTDLRGMKAGAYVELSVTDTGIGMDRQTAAKAFDPFFTTKEIGQGTGLGLAMVYGFAKQSGGHAEIISKPGLGTTVNIWIPAMTERRVTATRTRSKAPTGREATILLVEDNDLVRASSVEQIESLGYRVIAESDGRSALEVITARNDIELLLTDVRMPGGMSGKDLAALAVKLRPSMKVLYTSGYTSKLFQSDSVSGRHRLLQKPYTKRQLAEYIKESLNG